MDRTILTAVSHKSRHNGAWEGPRKQKPALTRADVWSIFVEIYKLEVRQRNDSKFMSVAGP